MLKLEPGSCVVFEGLDSTGKSTQLALLRDIVEPTSTVFAHMPSGFSHFTERVYEALEHDAPSSGLAQQLAHLACHAESMGALTEALRSRALVLDRFWWSTLAYGWYGGSVRDAGVDERTFSALVDAVWSPVTPSLIFAFLEPHNDDYHNREAIADAYRHFVARQPDVAVLVPRQDARATHARIVDTLIERGLAHLK